MFEDIHFAVFLIFLFFFCALKWLDYHCTFFRVNFVNCPPFHHVIVKMVEYVLETNAFALQVMSGTSVRKWTPVVVSV